MKIISKKISLEPYKSRINGSLTSYNGDDWEEFNNYDIKSKYNNYGMFPYDVIYNGMILSYPTLMERYYFCKRYKELLKYDNCVDGGNYENAVTYYTHNFKYDLESLKKEYEDLDAIYAEYGGDVFFNWCESILYGGKVKYSNIWKDLDCEKTEIEGVDNTAHILIPILFTNTIDDMGEFSIFCDEWEEGAEYTKGDIAIYDDEIWLKTTDGYGSIYSEKYKELYFPQIGEKDENGNPIMSHDENYQWYEKSNGKIEYSESQWKDYTDYYFSGNGVPNDIRYKDDCTVEQYNTYVKNTLSSVTTYAVRNGKVFYNADPMNDMAYKYTLITSDDGFYYIDGKIYNIIESEYIKYKNTFLIVYDVDNFIQLNEKYCYVKGQKIYSKTKEDLSHYFLIDGDEYTVDVDKFIRYKETAYKVDLNSVKIQKGNNEITYPKIDAYSIIDGKIYLISDDEIITLKRNDDGTIYSINNNLITDIGQKVSNINNQSSGYTINNNIIYVFKPYYEFSVDTMSGYTESKLSSFVNYNVAFDDMGNKLPGSLIQKEDGTYEQPTENSYLDLLYRVGNTNNLTLIEEELNNSGKIKKQVFFGNVISEISFYYIDYYGNIINESVIKCKKGESLLSKINECKTKLKDIKSDENLVKNHYSVNEDIKCGIKYHMGALLDKDYNVIENNSGVTYEEETTIIDKTFNYHFDEFSSYIIHYYDFEYNETFDKLNEYSNEPIKVGKSYFSYKIDNIIDSNNINKYRAKHDGMIAAPVFREEYKFGSSSLENIDSNIYIDRGFSASFERHLKLLDVNSMESLENYGNGFYNIIES